MPDIEDLDPRTLSFSQANGYEELPQPLALEIVSDDARRRLWDLLWLAALRTEKLGIRGELVWPWDGIFVLLHFHFWKEPLDRFSVDASAQVRLYRTMILSDLPFNRLFDMWQMIMRHEQCPQGFARDTARIFEDCQLAYIVDTNGPPTILPAVTPQEGKALQDALRQLRDGNYRGAETHLREAGTQINASEWAESVRESIHAVESVARKLDPRHAATLASALQALEKQIRIHPALKDAFGKLYGYTSDEDGVRHSLLEDSSSPVGRDEAVFMLGACASFVTYLLSKSRTGATQ